MKEFQQVYKRIIEFYDAVGSQNNDNTHHNSDYNKLYAKTSGLKAHYWNKASSPTRYVPKKSVESDTPYQLYSHTGSRAPLNQNYKSIPPVITQSNYIASATTSKSSTKLLDQSPTGPKKSLQQPKHFLKSATLESPQKNKHYLKTNFI